MVVRMENREDPDLGLRCLSSPFKQMTSVQRFLTLILYRPSDYGGPRSLSRNFKIWPITFQGQVYELYKTESTCRLSIQ